MKLCLTLIAILHLSCISTASTKEADDHGFAEFKSLKLGSSNEFSHKWGSPQKKSTEKIGGRTFSVLNYSDRRTEVWLDATNDKVVLKIFFPLPSSRLANLDKVLLTEFAGQKFEKIKKKCPLHAEVIYLNRQSGLFVNSRDVTDAQAFSVSFADPGIIDLFLKEDETADCRK